MLGDDDLKFSMDEIVDLVSELFGEKVDKVNAKDAREILKRESENFLSEVMSAVASPTLTEEEKAIVDAYELEKLGASELLLDIASQPAEEKAEPVMPSAPEVKIQRNMTPETSYAPPKPDTEMDDFKRELEMQAKAKLAEAQKKTEADAAKEEETRKKREELLKRVEENERRIAQAAVLNAQVQQAAKQAQAPAPAASKSGITYNDIIPLIKMFDDSQKIFMAVLSKLIKKKAVMTMFVRTLEKAMKRHPAVLRKADIDSKGSARADGTIEPIRVFSNVNAIEGGPDKRDSSLFWALKDIFEERIIATEMATTFETKDEVVSNLFIQTEKYFTAGGINHRLKKVFFGKIFPDTTLKPGE